MLGGRRPPCGWPPDSPTFHLKEWSGGLFYGDTTVNVNLRKAGNGAILTIIAPNGSQTEMVYEGDDGKARALAAASHLLEGGVLMPNGQPAPEKKEAPDA